MKVSKALFVEVYFAALHVHVAGPSGAVKLIELPLGVDFSELLWRLEYAYEFNEKARRFRPFVQFSLRNGFVCISYSSPTAYQKTLGVTHDDIVERLRQLTFID